MAIKRKRTMKHKRLPVAIEHTQFYGYFLKYREALALLNYSQKTWRIRESNLRRFVGWCDERGIETPQQVTKPILDSYQKYLFYYRQDNGEPLSPASRSNYINRLKQFFKWLTRENYLLYNPASELPIPRSSKRLPVVLSEDEVERILLQPNVNRASGLRDRAILEVLYSTGIRRLELCNLDLCDVSLTRLTLHVRHGKGDKDRLLPLGSRAAHWLGKYLEEARPKFVLSIHDETLFLNDYGERFKDSKLGDRVKRFINNAGITVAGSCHLLRHAMATHMLENGADTRFIQAMLGHANLTTTQIYTHVSIRKLQEIHTATHPAKLESKEDLLAQLQLENEQERDT